MALTQLTIGDARFHAGRWQGRAEVATLIPLTEARTLHRESLRAARTMLQNQGFRAVVTGPVGPPERTAFLRDGFSEREQLHLLRYDLRSHDPRSHDLRRSAATDAATSRTGSGRQRRRPHRQPRSRQARVRRVRVRRATGRDWDEILAVDQHSFDEFWRFDRDGLEDSILATPASRLRVIRGGDLAGQSGLTTDTRDTAAGAPSRAPDNELVGYALAGHSGASGYLQRIAVHPACRRQGVGTLLVDDALLWIRRRGATTGWVNTQKTNESALRLYQNLGFTLQEHPLTVMYRALT